ncbi:MAG: prolipoprotein diacylglyceryl transferase [Bdellovibrionota bacterium]
MKPFLFLDTAFETPTYFILYLLAFLGASVLAAHRAPTYGLSSVRAIDLGICAFIGGFLGARIFHILFEAPSYYFSEPLRIFYFWQGGFVLFGGLSFGILLSWIFLKLKNEPIGRWADLAAPSVLLGIGIGRVGCLATGCCYGSVTDWWWGLVFSEPGTPAPLGVSLHPTQILESLFGFLSALFFLIIFRKPPKKSGSAFLLAMISYGLFRFAIEFLRGDSDRGLYLDGQISTSQILALLTVMICFIWLMKLKKQPESSKNIEEHSHS